VAGSCGWLVLLARVAGEQHAGQIKAPATGAQFTIFRSEDSFPQASQNPLTRSEISERGIMDGAGTAGIGTGNSNCKTMLNCFGDSARSARRSRETRWRHASEWRRALPWTDSPQPHWQSRNGVTVRARNVITASVTKILGGKCGNCRFSSVTLPTEAVRSKLRFSVFMFFSQKLPPFWFYVRVHGATVTSRGDLLLAALVSVSFLSAKPLLTSHSFLTSEASH